MEQILRLRNSKTEGTVQYYFTDLKVQKRLDAWLSLPTYLLIKVHLTHNTFFFLLNTFTPDTDRPQPHFHVAKSDQHPGFQYDYSACATCH